MSIVMWRVPCRRVVNLLPRARLIVPALSDGGASFAVGHAASLSTAVHFQCKSGGGADAVRSLRCDLRVALGLATGAAVLLAQPDLVECAPKRSNKAADAPTKKKKAGPALNAIEASLHAGEEDV